MPEAGHGVEKYDLLGYATGGGHLCVDHPFYHPFSHPFRPPAVAALAVACGRSRETAPAAPVPEVPEEDLEAVPPLGGWYHLLLQVRKMFPQGRNHLRAGNAPRGAGKRPPHHQPREKNRRRARSGLEVDKGYLTLREVATRYGQFPRRTLLGSPLIKLACLRPGTVYLCGLMNPGLREGPFSTI